MTPSVRLKSLNEQHAAKRAAAQAIFDGAKDGVLSPEQRQQVDGLQKEVEGIAEQIHLEARQLAQQGAKAPALSKTEQRDVDRFDFGTLLRSMYANARGNSRPFEGVEAELISEGEKEAREAGVQGGGIFLPRMLVRRRSFDYLERRDMTATGTTSVSLDQGGMTIATGKAGLLDDFFNASVLRAGGATVLEGLVGNLDIPRIVAGTAGAAKAENANADEVSPTTAMLQLSPNRLPAYIDISERLLAQASSPIEAILRRHIVEQMTAVQEAAFFHGSGTNEANGIAGTSGIGSVAGGTNGAAPDWADVVDLETAVDTNNALLGALHYVSNGKVRGFFKKTPKVSSTDSRMILEGNDLNGYTPLWTNAVSRTLTKGSSGAVCSAIFFGNLIDYVIAYWGGVNLEMVRDKSNAIAGLYTLVATSYYDGGVMRPKSFAAMLDAIPT